MKTRKDKAKKIITLLILLIFTVAQGSANMPVIDISNLMNSVSQLYAIYDQINATIEQVQNTYQQLETQINSIKNMDWNDLKGSFADGNWSDAEGFQGTWENIGKFRTNLTDATSVINDNLNLINNVKNTLENKTVTCMGKQYTVAGLFGIGKYGRNNLMNLPASAWDYVKEAGEEIAKGYAGKLTYKEKEAIMNRWGLDPENYAYYKLVEEQVNDLTSTLLSKGTEEYYTAELTKAAKNNEALLELSNNAGESITGQMQATTGAILSLKSDIINLTYGVRETAAMFATESKREEVAKAAKAERDAVRKEQRKLEYQKQTGYVPSWL